MRMLLTAALFATPLLASACLLPPMTGSPAAPSAEPDPTTDSAAQHASPAAAAPAAPTAAAAPAVVSVTLRNECPQGVKVFFGDKPKFGSGTYSSLSSNTRTSKQMRAGDMIWLVDDGQNGLASVTIDARTREVSVNRDCAGLTAR
jgi:hypothetical protein